MRRLREHVQQAAACHAVAFLHEDAGVAGERAGVAGDVDDARGRVFCIQRFAQRLRSGARRVQQPALGFAPGFQLFRGDGKEVGTAELAARSEAVRGGVGSRAHHHFFDAFKAKYVRTATRQRQGEVAKPAEEIKDARARRHLQGGERLRDQFTVERLVYLGEVVRHVGHGEVVSGQGVGERGGVRRMFAGFAPALQPDLPRLCGAFVPAGDGFRGQAVADGFLQADAQYSDAVAFADIDTEDGGLLCEAGAECADVRQAGGDGCWQGEAALKVHHAR